MNALMWCLLIPVLCFIFFEMGRAFEIRELKEELEALLEEEGINPDEILKE